MRIAYVGLSAPLMYDYRNPATRTQSDLSSSPNPILDSPFGLMLLYDEVWFLCRSLCPENMRYLSFVRFIDEEGLLPDLSDIDISKLDEGLWDDPAMMGRYNRVKSFFDSYDTVKHALGINWSAAADNHTHSLQVGSIVTSANSVSLKCILFDLEDLKRLNRDDVELIANSFGQHWIEDSNPAILEASLTHILTIDHIPNYLTPKGPYHPVIDEARANRYLVDFREWISSKAKEPGIKEIKEIKEEIEASMRQAQEELFLKYLDPKSSFFSIGKTLGGAGIDLLVPQLSTGISLVKDLIDWRKKKRLRWQGFIVSLSRVGKSMK